MTGRRNYAQFCGLAAGLNIIGERWALLIVRELLIGPARFNEILTNLPGLGPNLLSDRLRALTEHGVIEAGGVRGDGRGKQYRLTSRGEQLREPVLALARWGMPFLTEDDAVSGTTRAAWGFLAVQAMINGSTGALGGRELRVPRGRGDLPYRGTRRQRRHPPRTRGRSGACRDHRRPDVRTDRGRDAHPVRGVALRSSQDRRSRGRRPEMRGVPRPARRIPTRDRTGRSCT